MARLVASPLFFGEWLIQPSGLAVPAPNGVERPVEPPSTVRGLPCKLRGRELLGVMDQHASCPIDAPQPGIELILVDRDMVLVERHTGRCPAVGWRWHDTAILPIEPLLELVVVIERVVEHAPQDLARRHWVHVAVALGDRARPTRVMPGEPFEIWPRPGQTDTQ